MEINCLVGLFIFNRQVDIPDTTYVHLVSKSKVEMYGIQ